MIPSSSISKVSHSSNVETFVGGTIVNITLSKVNYFSVHFLSSHRLTLSEYGDKVAQHTIGCLYYQRFMFDQGDRSHDLRL